MKLESSELIFLNTFSQNWSFTQKDGTVKDGSTSYMTVQDISDNSVIQFKLDKDYIFPNQLKSGAHIKVLFKFSKYGKQINLTVIGVHVLENLGF